MNPSELDAAILRAEQALQVRDRGLLAMSCTELACILDAGSLLDSGDRAWCEAALKSVNEAYEVCQ